MAWEQAEETSDNWLVQFLELDILRPIADFILKHNRCNSTEFVILKQGSYNISLRMKYRNYATVIRFSQPGAVFCPEEKIVNEVAVVRFLMDQAAIPIPFILHSGTRKERPLELSPFIMMTISSTKRKTMTLSTHQDVPKRRVEFWAQASTKTGLRCCMGG